MKNPVLLLMLFASVIVSAQNLAPNPSFEDTVSCPLSPDEMFNAVSWSSYRGSPDYMNECGNQYQNFAVTVPKNGWGYQPAYDGKAYAFAGTYIAFPGNLREYIGAQLLQPLTIGTKYFVSAFVSRAYSAYVRCATNNFGFRFSTVAYSASNPAPLDNFSHVYCDSVIKDTTNWIHVAGSFAADSAYQFIIIGNFYDDAHTDTFDCPTDGGYYIDFICVSPDSLNCKGKEDGVNSLVNSEVTIFPVPADGYLLVNGIVHADNFSIINYIGQLCISGIVSGKPYTIDVSSLTNGFYFFQFGHTAPQKILIIHSR